jgi:hypothetical protein
VKQGLKNDQDKIRTEYLQPEALLGTAKILTFGGKKYGEWNFLKGIKFSRVYAACLRHLLAWFMGQNKDPETGESHLDHASACIMFLQTYTKNRKYKKYDDRPTKLKL